MLRSRESMPDALAAVLEYLWDEEERDYRKRAPEDCSPHIFEALQVLADWLDRHWQEVYPRVPKPLLPPRR